MLVSKATFGQLVPLLIGLISAACDLECPRGYTLRGDTCYPNKDAGFDDASQSEVDRSGDSPDASADAHGEDGSDSAFQSSGQEPIEEPCPVGFSGTSCEIDACDPNPCQHGGLCSHAEPGASCDCTGTGYEGAACQVDVDECISPNACINEAYPCVQTKAPGYTCQGQLADWPMPDAVVGSKTKPSYSEESGAGVVIDNITGLAWQQRPPAILSASECAESDGCTWQEATAYCDKLVLGRYHDFRLPTRIELESIVDDTGPGPTIDSDAFPNAGTEAHWTASPIAGVADRASAVSFSNGVTFESPYAARFRMRCVQTVRKVPSLPSNRYIAGLSATVPVVTDVRTGLIWQQTINVTERGIDGAKAFCSSLGSSWRVPTKKELLTLIDPTMPPWTSIPPIHPIFTGTPPDAYFWSSSPVVEETDHHWLVHVSGVSQAQQATTQAIVRCVR